jgi:hypothetical protein
MNLNPLPWLFGRWLQAELPDWSAAGMIRADQEQQIRERYQPTGVCSSVARCASVTLITLAAAAVLLALLLLIWSRWSSIPWGLKFGPALVLMLAAHGVAYWLRFPRGDARRGDWLFLAGSLLFGLCAWLIVERVGSVWAFHAGFVFWMAAAVPLGVVLGSAPFLSGVMLLSAAWLVCLVFSPDPPSDIYPDVYLVLFLLPLGFLTDWSYRQRERGVFIAMLLALVVWWCVLPLAWKLGEQGVFWAAGLAPILYLAGLRHDEAHPFRPVYERFGQALGGVALLGLALPSITGDLMLPKHTLRYWLALLALAAAAVAWAPGARRVQLRRHGLALAAAAGITLLPGLVGAVSYGLAGLRHEATDPAVTVAIETELTAVPLVADESSTKPAAAQRGATNVVSTVFNAAALALGIGLVLCGVSSDRWVCLACGAAYLMLWATLLICDLLAREQIQLAALALVLAGAALLGAARTGPRWWRPWHESNPSQAA